MTKKITKDWYKDFYSHFYLQYFHNKKLDPVKLDKEIHFITKALELKKGQSILDLGCGTGRHAICLTNNYITVTALDFYSKFLAIGKHEARQHNVTVNFVKGDMRDLSYHNCFDAVISMYTSFGYFNGTGNLSVLKGINKALKKKGKFILDIPSKYWTLNKLPRASTFRVGKDTVQETKTFNNRSQLLQNTIRITGSKDVKEVTTSLRLYSLTELKNIMSGAGFEINKVFGSYDTNDLYKYRQSKRMIVLAVKLS